MTKNFFVFLLLGVTLSCSKESTPQTAPTTTQTSTTVTFDNYIKTNILNTCTGCHGTRGGVSYSGTYADLFAKKSKFNSVIQNGSMPEGNPFSSADKTLVQAWIDRGAPER